MLEKFFIAIAAVFVVGVLVIAIKSISQKQY